jgi:hypothetical protein
VCSTALQFAFIIPYSPPSPSTNIGPEVRSVSTATRKRDREVFEMADVARRQHGIVSGE